MAELWQQLQEVFLNLFNSEQLMEVLKQPEITVAAFVALNLIIFTETGLMVGFFLPGDSLLVTTGIVAYAAGWDLPLLMFTLTASAIVGDTVGYWIGAKAGPRLFTKEKSLFFRPQYLEYAREFYERHGAKTIVLARFMPFLRTFAPVVAGIGKMEYRRFLSYNVIGAAGWIVSMLAVGYLLTPVLEPALQGVFGEDFRVRKYISVVILVVVFLSISPALYAAAKYYFSRPSRARNNEKPTERVAT